MVDLSDVDLVCLGVDAGVVDESVFLAIYISLYLLFSYIVNI
jgi:hypothetical protein